MPKTGTERFWKHFDKSSDITVGLNEAIQNIDQKRRKKGLSSLNNFMEIYCKGILFDDKTSDKMKQAIDEMDMALSESRPYQIMLPRSSGKTTTAECSVMYALASGRRKFAVVISQSAASATNVLNDIFRIILEPDTAFAQDFPEICYPITQLNGGYRRKQLYNGEMTEIVKNSTTIQLPKLKDENGKPFPTSGSVIISRGISAGIRGLKIGKLRPDLVLLDDIQTTDSAQSPEQVQKLLGTINKDILNLAGKHKLSLIVTATPICADDLTFKLRENPNWKTTIYKAIEKFPKNMDLWNQYFKLYDSESLNDKKHTGSLKFYKEHRSEMDEGAVLFNPDRFSKQDGHISGLQKLLEIQHTIGNDAFTQEFLMTPVKAKTRIDITPNIVVKKTNSFKELEIPDGFVMTVGAVDLNTSFGATCAILSFKTDMTAIVNWYNIFPLSIDQQLNPTSYSQAVYNALVDICRQIKQLGVKLDGVAIDCGGRQWDSVCNFTKNAKNLVGLNTAAFAGRSSLQFNQFVRSRLRNAQGQTVLCGSPEERVRAGAGQKYVFFNADFYKEVAQTAFLSEVLAPGSCSLYTNREHNDFAIQICNETLQAKITKANRDIYVWKSINPHDYLDCLAMCYACVTQLGLSPIINTKLQTRFNALKKKPKIRII